MNRTFDRLQRGAGLAVVATAMLILATGSARGAEGSTFFLSEYLRTALTSGPAAQQARLEQERIGLQEQMDRARQQPTLSAWGAATLQPTWEGLKGTGSPAGVPGGELGLLLSKGGPVTSQTDGGAAAAGTAVRPVSSNAWSFALSVDWQAQAGPWQWDRQPARLTISYERPLWPPVLADPAGFEARRVRAEQEQRQLTVQAIQAFYGTRQALAAYRTAWRRAALAQRRYEAAQALVESGARGPTDLFQAQDRLAEARKELFETWRRTREALVTFTSTAALSLPGFAGAPSPPAPETLGLELVDDLRWEEAFRALASLLGLEAGARLDALSTWQSAGRNEALTEGWRARALQAHPDVADATLAVREAEVRLTRARQAAEPSVEFSAQVTAALEPGKRLDPRFTVSLSQPIWAPAARHSVQDAAVALEMARHRLRSAQEQAIRQLEQTWWDLGLALAAADDARSALARAEQTLNQALYRQERGLAPTLDVEQASLAVEQARGEVEAASSRVRLQWLRLAAVLGIEPGGLLGARDW